MLKITFVCLLFALIGFASAQLKSRAMHNFFCNDILNKQIKKEFEASHTYLSLANYYAHDSQALHGFSKMFEHSWKEETTHGTNLMSYIIKRGGSPCTPVLEKPQNDTKWSDARDVCEVLDIVLELEKSVTEHLLLVHQCAGGENNNKIADSSSCQNKGQCPVSCTTAGKHSSDPHLQDFLESEYLSEQVDSIKELADLRTRLDRVKCKEYGLHMIDQELLAKYSK